MDNTARQLANVAIRKLDLIPASARLLIAIAGFPASGKSTLAELIVRNINSLLENAHAGPDGPISPSAAARAIVVGLDGWHLTRAQLDAMADPQLAHDRRGAHWTFDSRSYNAFVRLLRTPCGVDAPIITAPSFNHAVKDPVPNAFAIHPHHRIVVIEGLYTMLDVDAWREAAAMMDERWWIDIDWEAAKSRLVKRHVLTGVAKDMNVAVWRADENDGPNGLFVAANLCNPTRTVTSIDDPAYELH